ncbi:hypothetical protein BJ508DRAFT_417974 [Ascobolus immersus RN42]|uniref:GYF domain-containing protein n=1 Tax=Ascobolus immersus RN42 TaxID=1160509 RepID=A0A3N4HV44_ASCIM|nr:hypothetical protein BJ508DRAFT_417974 [Ascobolus immersus RN42]
MSSASLSLGFSSSSANKDNMNSNNTANGGSNTSNGERGGGGASGIGSGDWIRRPNGTSTTNATNTSSTSSSTHRRPSLSTTLTHNHNSSAASLSSSNANVYHPPHHFQNSSSTPTNTQFKYPREQLLSIFKNLEADKSNALNKGVESLLGEWANSSGGGESGGASTWNRASEEQPQGAEVCWDRDGSQKPIALKEMDEAEKELFSGNINSPQKVPQQNQSQQNTPQGNRIGGIPGNKNTNRRGGDLDISTSSPIRPNNRRRETLETPGASSPLHSSPGGPGTLSRRRTDGRANIGDAFDSPSTEGRHHNFSRWGQKDDPEDSKERETTRDVTGGRTGGLFRRPSAAWTSSASNVSAALATTSMGTFGSNPAGGGMGAFSLKEKKSQNLNSQKQKTEEESSEKGSQNPQGQQQKQEHNDNRPTTSDTDPFGRSTESSSPANGAGRPDDSQSNHSDQFSKAGLNSTTAAKLREEMGFSSIGRTGNFGGLGSLNTQFNQMNLNQHGQEMQRGLEHDPISPTETNPYQSPVPGKEDDEDTDHGLGSIGGGVRRGLGGIPLSDNSTPSRSGMRTPGTGLGGIPLSSAGNQPLVGVASSSVWGTPGSAIGTPLDRLGSGAGGIGLGGAGFFGGLDLSSPGGNMLGGGAFGSAGRGSRLGSLFPVEQQAPHHHQDEDQHLGRMDRSDSFDSLRLGTINGALGGNAGRRGFGSLANGGIDSPLRERGDIQTDLFGQLTSSRGLSGIGPSENPLFVGLNFDQRVDPRMHPQMAPQTPSHSINTARNSDLSQSSIGTSVTPGSATTPMPIQQQSHILVMPDKIQWEYRDPTGTTQGPFTGLEMHEWYKAGFFTSELMVRRADGSDFEALGSLIRKIGNTREPFLVPLPALSPANPTVTLPSNAWGSTAAGVITSGWLDAQNNNVQAPPFPGSFPSFGTTLTADQQNALERRKQEEQYLMARQREFLLQQQKTVLQQTFQQQQQQHLNHQHSTQSLHSHPSLGSLTGVAPSAFPLGQPQVGMDQGILRQASAGGLNDIFAAGAGGIGEHDLQAMQYVLNQQAAQHQAQQQQQQQAQHQAQQHAQQQAQLQQQQQQQHISPPAFQQQQPTPEPEPEQNYHFEQQQQQQQQQHQSQTQVAPVQQEKTEVKESVNQVAEQEQTPEPQVEAPKPVAEQPTAAQPKSAWNTVEPVSTTISTPVPESKSKNTSPKALQFEKRGWNEEPSSALPAPFPPPPSTVKSSEAPGTPKVETPSASVAPWAKDTAEQSVPKGPSLKEIQELEAAQAAKAEAIANEQRKLELQQQIAAAQAAGSAAAPGLPSSATWASVSPNPGANTPSAWAKPLQKPAAPTKKTLSQIQKEEEARKAKAAAAQAVQVSAANAAAGPAGKRYADLAGKIAQPTGTGAMVGGAWTTVGPGGKSKNGSALAPQAIANSVNRPPLAPATSLGLVKPKPAPAKPATNVNAANDEFQKWCRVSLKALNNGVNVENFVESLLCFPADAELIADSVYANSTIIDGRRFAEEFIRRRKAAAAGQVLEAGAGLPNIGGASASDKVGGWNEVAKKNSAAHTPRDVPETNSAFKVVPGKKRGKK